MILPEIPITTRTQRQQQGQFYGLNHNDGANANELFDMLNLTSDRFPLLSTRHERGSYGEETEGDRNGIFSAGKLIMAAGTGLYADGTKVADVENSRKVFAALGERVVIFPDKLLYDGGTGDAEPLEQRMTFDTLIFEDGTYAGEPAKANTIYSAGADWGIKFRVGDAVTISGCTTHPENNRTSIIREIAGDELHFYENTFTVTGLAYTETGELKVERTVPDLDFLCSNENRLWGCRGDTIWASKLGDPYNWNVFDGISTDAWSVDTGTVGNFTGCASYGGYPTFFKEDRIFKVYGDKPSNFEMIQSAAMGVKAGCDRSLAICNETLFYVSPAGVVAYSGGVPTVISAALGPYQTFDDAAGGADKLKYYLCVMENGVIPAVYVYDTTKAMWHMEDSTPVSCMANHGGMLIAETPAVKQTLTVLGSGAAEAAEGSFDSAAEFGDADWGTFDKKHPMRLRIRAEVESGGKLQVLICYDSKGPWKKSGVIKPQRKGIYTVSFPIRRCDHYRIRLEGHGQWKVYTIEQEYYAGGVR
ncbi:MAG: hypothetical protein MJ074_08440 [Oscillospiraceae bacterium]|nr:hypothetical protein [Oscillospiraceae bacterium]